MVKHPVTPKEFLSVLNAAFPQTGHQHNFLFVDKDNHLVAGVHYNKDITFEIKFDSKEDEAIETMDAEAFAAYIAPHLDRIKEVDGPACVEKLRLEDEQRFKELEEQARVEAEAALQSGRRAQLEAEDGMRNAAEIAGLQ